MVEIGIILFLILLNGVLAGSEAAVIASKRVRLRELADAGVKGASAALTTLESPLRFLSTVQVGITLIGIISGVFGGATIAEDVAEWLGRWEPLKPVARPMALGLVVVAITYFSLVLGELVPKRLAMEHPEGVARRVAGPMRLLSTVVSPVVMFLTSSSNLLLRPLGVRGKRTESVSDEEIRSVIRLGASSGVLELEEGRVIERVFAMADRRAGSLMIPRRDVECLAPDASGEEVTRFARASRDTHLPVSPGGLDELLGVVSVVDLAHAGDKQPGDLIEKPLFIPETVNALGAIELFRRANAQIAFVADEHGTIDGMLRLADLIEDILGEVGDEPDTNQATLVRRDDGALLMSGLLPLADFLEEIEERPSASFDPSVYHSVGGLVVHHMGKLPSAGDRVEIGPWRFEVVSVDGRRVDQVLATLID